MSISDGFNFWFGATLASFAIGALALGGFILIAVCIVMAQEWIRKKRKAPLQPPETRA